VNRRRRASAILLPAILALGMAGWAIGAPSANQPASAAPQQTRDQGTLEVTADHDLEWLQQDHAYVARGNAVAKRGTVTLMGDLLIAYYRPMAKPPGSGAPAPGNGSQPASSAGPAVSGTRPPPEATTKPGATPSTGFDTSTTEIWRVVAEGNVHIVSEDKDAYGDRLEYDKDAGVVVLTGNNLKATTLTETVTARDTLEYWDNQDMAVARGNALIVKFNGDTLAGDVIGGHFVKNAQNQSTLKTIESRGHVVVTTATDIVHGDQGVYDLDAHRTVLVGNVRATRGDSELEGETAEVNNDTGISQVFPGPGQRVHGLFAHQTNPSAPPPAKTGSKH